jgi:hypothetical protein
MSETFWALWKALQLSETCRNISVTFWLFAQSRKRTWEVIPDLHSWRRWHWPRRRECSGDHMEYLVAERAQHLHVENPFSDSVYANTAGQFRGKHLAQSWASSCSSLILMGNPRHYTLNPKP